MQYIQRDLQHRTNIISITDIELDQYLKLLNELNNDYSLKFTQREKYNRLLQDFRNIKRNMEEQGNNITDTINKLNQYDICSYDNKCNNKATKVLTMVDAYDDKKYINPLALCDQHVTQLEQEMRKAGMNDINIFNDINKFKNILSDQHKDISDEHEY